MFAVKNRILLYRILFLRRVAFATSFHSASVRFCRAFLFHRTHFPMKQKDPLKSGSDSLIIKSSYCSIASIPETGLLFAQAGTFRKNGVAVASQILCISTTLNKRKASIRLFGYKLQLFPLFVKHFLLTNAGNRQIFSFSCAGKATHRPLLICPV